MFEVEHYGDRLRYAPEVAGAHTGVRRDHGPVVVWNCTRTCNLHCVHCYSSSEAKKYSHELTGTEARRFIDDLAYFRVPVLLFSGGEPLTRPDLLELVAYAGKKGIRPTLSTNGTLITPQVAAALKQAGVGYVGISLDGIGANNDRFRGKEGAFEAALQGITNCQAAGQKVGLRFTITRYNYQELDRIFDLIDERRIPRVCLYHFVQAGRGEGWEDADLNHEERREVMRLIIGRTADFYRRQAGVEVLTVDNHADGIFLYHWLQQHQPERAGRALALLRLNGGNRSGMAIGEVDWSGNVHPDQFSLHHHLGNVCERPFSAIWTDQGHPLLSNLRNRKPLLKGRCARCRWLEMCNGNLRARAEAATGDFWGSDPACYLTDAEIA
jgi:putative heme d1 biosynthesis radical SAM protein NirJ1